MFVQNISTDRAVWHYIPEDRNPPLHPWKNLTSHSHFFKHFANLPITTTKVLVIHFRTTHPLYHITVVSIILNSYAWCLCDRASFYYNNVNNQQDATTFSFINLFNSALHVSGDKFAHPQEHFSTVYAARGTMRPHCCQPVPRLRWN